MEAPSECRVQTDHIAAVASHISYHEAVSELLTDEVVNILSIQYPSSVQYLIRKGKSERSQLAGGTSVPDSTACGSWTVAAGFDGRPKSSSFVVVGMSSKTSWQVFGR